MLVTETTTTKFNYLPKLLKPDDKNVHVTICNENISYEKWLKRIHKSVGDDLFYNWVCQPIRISSEDPFDYTTHLTSIQNVIKDFSPDKPRNVRIDMMNGEKAETWIFLLGKDGLSDGKDINSKISFFTHHSKNNTYVEKLRWLNFVTEVLGPDIYNNVITDFKVTDSIFFDEIMFAEPKEIFELLRIKYSLKDVRISINNQTWIIYTLTD